MGSHSESGAILSATPRDGYLTASPGLSGWEVMLVGRKVQASQENSCRLNNRLQEVLSPDAEVMAARAFFSLSAISNFLAADKRCRGTATLTAALGYPA